MNELETILVDLIEKQPIAYISSIDEEGYPTGKAVFSPRLREGLKCYYFSTNLSTWRAQQYLRNNKASVYFCDQTQGVMLQGKMEVLQDSESRRKIWKDEDVQYYEEGVDDSDYCVLKFTAIQGRHYFRFQSMNFKVTSDGIQKIK